MKSPHRLCTYLIKKARHHDLTGFCIVIEDTLRYQDSRNTFLRILNRHTQILWTPEMICKAQLQPPFFGIVREAIVGLFDIHQRWSGAEQIHSGESNIYASGHVPEETHIPCDKRVNSTE